MSALKGMGTFVSARTFPRWVIFFPTLISFLALQTSVWELESLFRRDVSSALSWIGVGFPNAFVFVVLPFAPNTWTRFAAMLLVNLAFLYFLHRTTPPKVSGKRMAIMLVGWLSLTIGSTLVMPYLMVWSFQAASVFR
jgi:hypothetical protein